MYRRLNIEHFDNNDNITISQKIVDSFNLDEYIAYNNDKEILKSGGIWNLREVRPYIMIGNNRIDINNNKNVYNFTDSYKHDIRMIYTSDCSDLIINNYMDEIKICYIEDEDKYVFRRKGKDFAEIKLDSSKKNNKIYKLRNITKITNYNEIYIVSFIIYNQINKELNISLDNIL